MPEVKNDRPYWFVGAQWDGEDQLDRFISEGIWANGYHEVVPVFRTAQRLI
ncbi:hypothetical protein [Thiosulfatihalobacter marinus]|uniref:hypothetical protein n=1 Tax=Thiosulfatihalobacter marinus TaxID=2792481 RepID=UPI0018D82D39|nr:hypothetical protein [Thiosulfatihalobacter marinus]